jgi:alcohol dehydrogenase class IV
MASGRSEQRGAGSRYITEEDVRMTVVTLLQPGRIVFGVGSSTHGVEFILGMGRRRAMIVAAPPVRKLAESLGATLTKGGASVIVYAEIANEPTVGSFEAALAAARAFCPDAVVGLGGGSALDVSKLIAALHNSDQDVRATFGLNKLGPRTTYLACLPTTSGTGSEVSPNAILLDEGDHLKKGVVSPYLVPDVALVDPAFTLSVPPPVTAATGIDALVHCVEAYVNRFAHPLVDLYALEGVRLIGSSLLRAVQHGDDLQARTQMARGSLYGGLCLGPVNTAAVHALAYPLGGEFHVAHGVSNAVLLAPVLQFNLPAAPDRYADVAVALGAEAGGSVLETAQRGVERMRELARSCGIPRGLSELGIPHEAIPALARSAMTVTRLLKNNVRELTQADAEAIYRGAY